MLVHEDHDESVMEDTASQQDRRGAQRSSYNPFDIDFERLFSPGLTLKMALPQASSIGMLAPLVPQSRELARGNNLGNESDAESFILCF